MNKKSVIALGIGTATAIVTGFGLSSIIISVRKFNSSKSTPNPNKYFEDSRGIVFNRNGEIIQYKGSTNIIDLSEPLMDKDDSNVQVPITKIGKNAFYGRPVKILILPSTIEEIGEGAFRYSSVETLNYKSDIKLKTIGSLAFEDHKIKDISIPSSVSDLQPGAFKTAHKIANQTLNFSNNLNLTKISYSTFEGNLFKELTLPKNVSSIQYYAFSIAKNYGNIDDELIFRCVNEPNFDDFNETFSGYKKVTIEKQSHKNKRNKKI